MSDPHGRWSKCQIHMVGGPKTTEHMSCLRAPYPVRRAEHDKIMLAANHFGSMLNAMVQVPCLQQEYVLENYWYPKICMH